MALIKVKRTRASLIEELGRLRVKRDEAIQRWKQAARAKRWTEAHALNDQLGDLAQRVGDIVTQARREGWGDAADEALGRS